MIDKYDLIMADPPWTYKDKAGAGELGAAFKYDLLTLEDIKDMRVNELAADNAVLMLWVTMPLLKEGIEVLEAWGFTYKTTAFCWVKICKPDLKALAGMAKDLFMSNSLQEAVDKARDMGGALLKAVAKPRVMMGNHTRGNVEIVLLGVKGKGLARQDASISQVVMEIPGKHSAKPQEVHRRIDALYGPCKRLELFARQTVPGWHCWGNECLGGVKLKLFK